MDEWKFKDLVAYKCIELGRRITEASPFLGKTYDVL
jgi:hypothetical protein